MNIVSPSIIAMLFAVNWVYKVLGKTSFYPMDDVKYCEDDSIKLLKDDEHAIIIGKSKPPTDVGVSKDCHIQIAPSEDNKYKHLQLRFDAFYINDCDIELQIKQAPSSEPENVKNMASLSCVSETPPVLYAQEGNLVMLKLQREEKAKIDYNFRINVTSTDGPVETGGLSSQLMIGLSVGGGVVLFILLLLLLKYLCNRRTNGEDSATDSASHQHDQVIYRAPQGGNPHTAQIDDPNRNKTPLTGYNARTGPQTPEHRALLPNGQSAVQNSGAPPGPGGGVDAEVTALTCSAGEENTSVQDSAYNSNEENLPERDHSFRAARGDSPPPSYEDAVGLPMPETNTMDSSPYSNLPQDRGNRQTV